VCCSRSGSNIIKYIYIYHERFVPLPLFYLKLPLSLPTMGATILVTGGSGLVGSAIKHVVNTEPAGSRFGKKDGETWIFLGSKDGDLRYAALLNEIRREI
jgi:hypothetical protein